MTQKSDRRAHALTDAASRHWKSRKIHRILERRIDLSDARVLDVGAGSGQISNYFQLVVKSVTAVDCDVSNICVDGMDIIETSDATLPFDTNAFDVVIFNHVIEHVGSRDDQRRSLGEIRRVLKTGGLMYLAVPSRWCLVEPHYRLPFLSWMPASLADRYVRALGKNSCYDCNPLGPRELTRLVEKAGFLVENTTVEAYYDRIDIEMDNRSLGKILSAVPPVVIEYLKNAMPTFVLIGKNGVE